MYVTCVSTYVCYMCEYICMLHTYLRYHMTQVAVCCASCEYTCMLHGCIIHYPVSTYVCYIDVLYIHTRVSVHTHREDGANDTPGPAFILLFSNYFCFRSHTAMLVPMIPLGPRFSQPATYKPRTRSPALISESTAPPACGTVCVLVSNGTCVCDLLVSKDLIATKEIC
jgi:hypothetical protein